MKREREEGGGGAERSVADQIEPFRAWCNEQGGGEKNCTNSHKKTFFVAVGAIFFTAPLMNAPKTHVSQKWGLANTS